MRQEERMGLILEELAAGGSVGVAEIAAKLGVSTASIRRDLQLLEKQRLLSRTHGGAVANSTAYELPLRYRGGRHREEKRRIAAAAAARVSDDVASVGLTGRTTTRTGRGISPDRSCCSHDDFDNRGQTMRRVSIGIVGLLALVLAAVALTAGCGSSGGGTPASPGASPTGVVNITMWHGDLDYAAKADNVLVAQWNKANPNIHVKALYNGSNDYALQKTLTAIAGGKPPDITYLFGSWMANIVKSPKVVLLNDLIANDPSFKWNDFWPAERLAATVNGKIVGLPALVDNLAIVYNKKLFDKAGLSYPTAQWTWDDFRAAAKKLTIPAQKQFGRVGPAELLLRRDGELLGGGAKVVPGPLRRRVRQAGLVEELLVVDDGEVVDERRQPHDLAVHRGRQPFGRPEVVPLERGVVGHQVVHQRDLGALDDVRHPRAEEIRDVWRLAAGDGGQGLLEGVVVAPVVQRRDVDVRVRLVPLGDEHVVGLGGVVEVAVPHGDVHDAGGAGAGGGRCTASG